MPRSELEGRLRAGARAYRRPAPAGLRSRVRAALSAGGEPAETEREARSLRLALALAAALVLFLGAAAWLRSGNARRTIPAEAPYVVSLSRELLAAPARVFELPAEAEEDLVVEARRIWLDTTRAAQGVVRGLPLPLRVPLERL
jgi:hypothetical protein